MRVPFSHLGSQFQGGQPIFESIKALVETGDFTLGKAVEEFETRIADYLGAGYAIGVNSGTDAIKLSLKALGIGHGDEVITAANTFWATIGAINEVNATPVLVDVDDTFCIAPEKIEAAITPKTKAIIPVHLTGNLADMDTILDIASHHGLCVVEDACQAIGAKLNGKSAGTMGDTGAFSLHPLKNLNVWGDGGFIVTDRIEIADKLRLLRNHGLSGRDTVEIFGCNSRLDTLQAIVALEQIPNLDQVTAARRNNADYYSEHLAEVVGVRTPLVLKGADPVWHLYQILCLHQDKLEKFLFKAGVEAKVHYRRYPYRQAPMANLCDAYQYRQADYHSRTVLSLPVHQYLKEEKLEYVVKKIREFYKE